MNQPPTCSSPIQLFLKKREKEYSRLVDMTIPYTCQRWVVASASIIYYFGRVIYLEKYFAITYLLLFHLLKISIKFVTPKGVPSIDEDDVLYEEIPTFNTGDNSDKPLLRKLGEFNFWRQIIWALLLAVILSHIEILDIPVFAPLLFGYFFFALYQVVQRQREHMAHYGYSYSDFFKRNQRHVEMTDKKESEDNDINDENQDLEYTDIQNK